MFAFVVLDLVFWYWAKRMAGKNVSKNDLFYVAWNENLSQSATYSQFFFS